jgi:hypothetical protein
MRRALPMDVRALLSEDSDESVRARVAWNRKTPKTLLQRLAADVSSVVSEPARRQISRI